MNLDDDGTQQSVLTAVVGYFEEGREETAARERLLIVRDGRSDIPLSANASLGIYDSRWEKELKRGNLRREEV